MDPFDALLENIRQHYLEAFSRSYNQFRLAASPSACEVLVEHDRVTEYAFRLTRLDMASNGSEGPKFVEVNPASHLHFDKFAVEIAPAVYLVMEPITWNGVDFTVDACPPLDLIEEWTLKWLDVHDRNPPDANGFSNVIHSVTRPGTTDSWTRFSVDFGSAPIAAFHELVAIFKTSGASVVEVRSAHLDDRPGET